MHSELLQLNPKGSLKIPDIFTMVSKILFHPTIKKELFCGDDCVSCLVPLCILKHDHYKGLKSDLNCEHARVQNVLDLAEMHEICVMFFNLHLNQ